MIDAVKEIESAAVLASFNHHFQFADNESTVKYHANYPFEFAQGIHLQNHDVMPTGSSLLVTKGAGVRYNFVDYSDLSALQMREQLVAKFMVSLSSRDAYGEHDPGDFYSWQLRVNDCRQDGDKPWERVTSSLHTLDLVRGEAPKIEAWRFGMQGTWSVIEPVMSVQRLSALVVRLVRGFPELNQEAAKHRSDKQKIEPEIRQLLPDELVASLPDGEAIDLRSIDLNKLSLNEKQRGKLRELDAKKRLTGFTPPPWKRPTRTVAAAA